MVSHSRLHMGPLGRACSHRADGGVEMQPHAAPWAQARLLARIRAGERSMYMGLGPHTRALSLARTAPGPGRAAMNELSCLLSVWTSQNVLEGLGQVTVGVLLPVHSLQILLLNQNVNAFLNHRDPWFEPG